MHRGQLDIAITRHIIEVRIYPKYPQINLILKTLLLVCFQVDPSGPLATLRKLLFSDGSLRSLRWFFVNHWYAVILIVIGVFLLMV